MVNVTSIDKARELKARKKKKALHYEGFEPCSQDMTICGDCDGNRALMKCPRLKEWLAKNQK